VAETLALIDYGAGNLHSVHNALIAAGARTVVVTDSADVVRGADRIVLPGVGAFGACIDALLALPDMIAAMEEKVLKQGTPFLGICVGMQLLADSGIEFGTHSGLGWIGGTVEAMVPTHHDIKIPHMGWNEVRPSGSQRLIAPGEAYFLHGYHFRAADMASVLATSDHGGPIVAAVGRDNIVGVQFHPEKSQAYGLSFLSRFLEWRP
jgi:glutamine amidotransferase